MNKKNTETIVDSPLVGEVWPIAQPGTDPVLYGHVDIEPKGDFAIRSLQTFRLTYTVGRFGLDDTGAIRVMMRAMGDGGRMQTEIRPPTITSPPAPAAVCRWKSPTAVTVPPRDPVGRA